MCSKLKEASSEDRLSPKGTEEDSGNTRDPPLYCQERDLRKKAPRLKHLGSRPPNQSPLPSNLIIGHAGSLGAHHLGQLVSCLRQSLLHSGAEKIPGNMGSEHSVELSVLPLPSSSTLSPPLPPQELFPPHGICAATSWLPLSASITASPRPSLEPSPSSSVQGHGPESGFQTRTPLSSLCLSFPVK